MPVLMPLPSSRIGSMGLGRQAGGDAGQVLELTLLVLRERCWFNCRWPAGLRSPRGRKPARASDWESARPKTP